MPLACDDAVGRSDVYVYFGSFGEAVDKVGERQIVCRGYFVQRNTKISALYIIQALIIQCLPLS